DDVLLLARHFLRAAADRAGVAPPRLPADVAAALASFPWPGNVRQLENEMSRLVALAGHGPVRKEPLSPRLAARPPPPRPAAPRAPGRPRPRPEGAPAPAARERPRARRVVAQGGPGRLRARVRGARPGSQ